MTTGDDTASSSIASSGVLSDPSEQAKRSKAGSNLCSLLPADHVLLLHFPCSKKKADKTVWPALRDTLALGLKGRADMGQPKWISATQQKQDVKKTCKMLLPLKATSETFAALSGPESKSVIVGPSAESADEARRFRFFWGEQICQLRRFEDGSIRESVQLRNPWGPLHLPAAVTAHLAARHEPAVQAEPLVLGPEAAPTHLQSRDGARKVGAAFRELSELLKANADPDLPIRRVRSLGAVVHAGVGAEDAQVPRVATGKAASVAEARSGCLLLKSKSTIAPGRVRSVPVTLDITHKKNMGPELFSHLKMAYLLNIKETLDSKKIRSAVKDRKLYLLFKGLVFSLDVDPPRQEDGNGDEAGGRGVPVDGSGLQNYLQSVGLRHPAWSAARHVVGRWVRSKMLESVLPEETADLLLAAVFESDAALTASPPRTPEAAVLRFLDLLSFHDFAARPILFESEDLPLDEARKASLQRCAATSRASLPAMVAATPFDGTAVLSPFTRSLSAADARRTVNLARQSLYVLLSEETGLEWAAFEEEGLSLGEFNASAYDIVIHLKPLQIPHGRRHTTDEDEENVSAFPVVDFDPVGMYLAELRESFSGMARFYHGRGRPAVGVRLEKEVAEQVPVDSLKHARCRFLHAGRLVPNVDAMVEDMRVLGTGIVKRIEVNFDR